MNKCFRSTILEKTGASSLYQKHKIQELWSGYGNIVRIGLDNASVESVVVKHIQLPIHRNQPRGWNGDIGHLRKLRSYKVDATWYQTYSNTSTARLPNCLAVETEGDEMLIVLEDLDVVGYSLRKSSLTWNEISSCLQWLARFHVSYLGKVPNGIWAEGSYWHLDTRPQELAALSDNRLKEAAPLIANKLNACEYMTFVHGDAKLANFCFSDDGRVAGVDFQYVGGGCGMKDVVYFIGSCLNESDCERLEDQILDTYFEFFNKASEVKNEALESEWRSMYRIAWADFHRFLKGWSPGHWKINSYSERIIKDVINNL